MGRSPSQAVLWERTGERRGTEAGSERYRAGRSPVLLWEAEGTEEEGRGTGMGKWGYSERRSREVGKKGESVDYSSPVPVGLSQQAEHGRAGWTFRTLSRSQAARLPRWRWSRSTSGPVVAAREERAREM